MKLRHHVRFVTAASLFDGHDAAIHIMRRILQAEGAEVIHLGHNRAAEEVVKAAVEEDAQAIAVSSYQGGHIEYFTYMLELLKRFNAPHIQIFGGGGGVIVPEEIALLEQRGIKKIFSPDDGLTLGLTGMIRYMLSAADTIMLKSQEYLPLESASLRELASAITTLELGAEPDKNPEFKNPREKLLGELAQAKNKFRRAPIIGITGTGGAGKSSLIDELVLRFLHVFSTKKIAILSIDPTKIKTGGALLGDRIRMNSAASPRVFVRSMATRGADRSVSKTAHEVLDYLAHAGFDLVILETAGIGQSDSQVTKLSDASVYVMTPEYGAPSQLEKIDMLDFASLIALNKFDKPGSLDALRDVRKTYQRNNQLFDQALDSMPVYGTSAHIFGDLGTNKFFNKFISLVKKYSKDPESWHYELLQEGDPDDHPIIPKKRVRYLSQVADSIREHHNFIEEQAHIYSRIDALTLCAQETEFDVQPKIQKLTQELDPDLKKDLEVYELNQQAYASGHVDYEIRGKIKEVKNSYETLSHTKIPRVIAPKFHKQEERARFVGLENLPGFFPFTAGVFPFKRDNEDPTRMFAGEGLPERTNKRFHYLSLDQTATRLSTAFDSVTLYGENPALRPDIYGKIGNAGVSVCSLDDAKRLYSGFDLIDPMTSVSMTINGPAPTMLAFFFNAAIDFEVEKQLRCLGQWDETKKVITHWFRQHNLSQPTYRASELPQGHNGLGLGFLGLPSSLIVKPELYNKIKDHVLAHIRGTIQADILKEDQAQNTCIFSTEFSLRMMGDCQQYFINNHINNFYSVSISGYHIAEAGANPISQLAFTLANGFTLLEYYRARGMKIDDFAKNFSFFFSNGVDPEYAVIGRVARRIWAIALKKVYQANERSQKLKYHIQTSGRSLHAQELAFNDIRTTLQALYAIADHCNSLHTNAYDEAITTPTEESVRRAVAIQMIINHELGLTKNENPWQGSYFIEYLTNQVEKAVLHVFDQLDARGGVLGAMETMYQRSAIQEESLYYEHKKHSGELPIIGVNTFIDPKPRGLAREVELMRSSDEEKQMQVAQVHDLAERFKPERERALMALKEASLKQENTFSCLMHAAQFATIGEITQSFFEVGGAYRRAM
jgi:methylmalonyl-CoA mutase